VPERAFNAHGSRRRVWGRVRTNWAQGAVTRGVVLERGVVRWLRLPGLVRAHGAVNRCRNPVGDPVWPGVVSGSGWLPRSAWC
jgi:hypothetical protein